jgi:asparagine synthase (glutamine-hydrolysing)
MFRYVGLIWDADNRTQSEAAELIVRKLRSASSQWREALDASGFTVFCAGARSGSMEVRALGGGSGVVLGSLFRRSHDIEDDRPAPRAEFGDGEQRKILDTQGRRLVDAYWGDYVALLSEPGSRRKWIVKDPTGNLPCFYTCFRGVTIIFSRLGDCIALDVVRFTINWEYVRCRVASGGFISDQNPLLEMNQVHRGEAVAFDPKLQPSESTRRLYWKPLDFSASDNLIENTDLAARALRATVRASTHTLAGSHASVLLRLSGGLDSSIVIGCLRNAAVNPHIVAYTYYNPRGSSDERRWARLAIQHTQYEHIEQPFDPAQVDLTGMLSMLPAAEPAPALMYLTRKSIEERLASTHACTGVLSGEGGDSSFGSESLGLAAAEYLIRHGPRARVFGLAAQVAVVMDASIWKILGKATRRWILGSKMRDYTAELLRGCRLTTPAVREVLMAQRRFPHPWFATSDDIPWETIHRLGALILTPEYYDPFLSPEADGMEHLAPLYSQPVVELCLRIPTYTHFLKGRDRGLAREAFAGDVPEQILRRQWKDRAPGFSQELAHRNLPFLREMLLDGILAREGLLDRQAVETVLRGELCKSDVVAPEIFKNLDIEVWLRSFADLARYKLAA